MKQHLKSKVILAIVLYQFSAFGSSASLTTGSNRSLRSLGRAKARPLTKRYTTIGTIGARKTVNDKESAWRKIEKAAIRCIDTRWSITELMHTPSVYTAVRRIFSFLSDL